MERCERKGGGEIEEKERESGKKGRYGKEERERRGRVKDWNADEY